MNRESVTRIEMTDEEWIEARKPKKVFAPLPIIEEKKEVDEPQKNEVAKKKPAKVHRNSNKTAMAGVQKKS